MRGIVEVRKTYLATLSYKLQHMDVTGLAYQQENYIY